VPVALALVTALTWGVNELLLLRAAKQMHTLTLGLWLMILGAAVIVPVAAWADPMPTLDDLPFAIAPALLALAGSIAYWLALRDGMLSIVSPTVATSGGVGAVIAIVTLGERFPPLALLGLGIAVAGVVLATFSRTGSAKGVWWAVLSAFLLGSYNVTLAFSAARIGAVWSVASYRLTGLIVLVPIVLAMRVPVAVERSQLRLLGVATLLETVGFVALTSALDIGPVAVASVVMAQFSTVAVVLAALVLHERLLRQQWIGVAMMIASTTMLGALQ